MKSDAEFVQSILCGPIPDPPATFTPAFVPQPPVPIPDAESPGGPAINQQAIMDWQLQHGQAYVETLLDQWPLAFAQQRLEQFKRYQSGGRI